MKRTLYITLLLCMLCFSACSKRIDFGKQPDPDPDPDPQPPTEMTVVIAPDWQDKEKPATLKAIFYTATGEIYNTYDISPDGGQVTLPKDIYKIILYNDDAESILFAQLERNETARAQIAATKLNVHEIVSPGSLYSCAGEVSTNSLQFVAPMKAHSIHVTIKLTIEDNIDIEDISIRLRNIADAVNLSTAVVHHSSTEAVNITPLAKKDSRDVFHLFDGIVFGSCQSEVCDATDGHLVYADIVIGMPDGMKEEFEVDITEAMHDAQQVVKEISIDISVKNISGQMQALVNEWTLGTASGGITQD